jgi:predicted MPP superfamily phosphohydrolase
MKLLLAHNPIILRRAARARVDLVLSGHTHGGQVTLRSERGASGKPRRRLLRGLGRQGDTQIYVTRGLGTVVLPIRYGMPSRGFAIGVALRSVRFFLRQP